MRRVLILGWMLLAWILTTPVLAELASPQADLFQGRLWRIEKDDKANYLMGTMHSEHVDVVTLPLVLRSYFNVAKTLVLEMVLDSNTMEQVGQAQVITHGPLLPELLGEKLYQRTADAMTDYGIPEKALRNMKPWFAMSVLMMPKSKTGLFLDLQLYYEALAQAKKIKGLESVEEQIAVFDTIPLADQVAMLEDTLDHLDEMDAYFAKMRELYLAGDLQALEDYSNELVDEEDPDLAQRFNKRFIVDRNVRMVERLEPILQRGHAFIAIGALHLPGEQGVLRLLQDKGYSVSVEY